MTAALSAEITNDTQSERSPLWHGLVAPLLFAAMTMSLFHGVLFSGHLLLSSKDADLAMQFLPWREFGFSQLRQGNLPLWNPYIYGGTPYFAGFQSALLYPPNWLHLLLPLTVAINLIIALHVFFAGYFTYLWARSRGNSIAAGVLAGIMFMFSGAYYLHIYAGHLPHLCLMPWVPLVWLSIEKLAVTGSFKWILSGIGAMVMVLLAGHPQYVYYTGIITGLYVLMLMVRSPHRLAVGGGFVAVVVGASLIVAVQLMTGAEAAGESVRSGGTKYEFASMFALPPENLITFIAPSFFGKLPLVGDDVNLPSYFGRCYLWEMSLYVSIAGAALALFAALSNWRKHLLFLILIAVTLVLALGKHLPTYDPLYYYLPAYSSFRCVAKFTFFLTLLVCALAADGLDVLARPQQRYWPLWTTASVALAGATIMLIYGVSVAHSAGSGVDGQWGAMLGMIQRSKELFTYPAAKYGDPEFIKASSNVAYTAAVWSSAGLAVVGAMFITARFKREATYGLLALAAVEMNAFAIHNRAVMDNTPNYPEPWLAAVRNTPGDFRVVNAALPGGQETPFLNQGLALGIQNLWGYDPGVLKRYAELLTASQGQNPDDASQYLQISRVSPGLFQMLRCKLALVADQNGPRTQELSSPLSMAELVSGWVLRTSRDDVLASVLSNDFNPRRTVILESRPAILPSADAPTGPAEIVAKSTDWVEIRTETSAPVLLLVTNNYSPGWRVVPIDKGPQDEYEIQPANYTQMAIPLAKGAHHIRIEYVPAAFRIGRVVSIVSLAGYLGACIVYVFVRRRRAPSGQPLNGLVGQM